MKQVKVDRNGSDDFGATALAILTILVRDNPGLLDGDTEVNGGDLVERLTLCIDNSTKLKKHLLRDLIVRERLSGGGDS